MIYLTGSTCRWLAPAALVIIQSQSVTALDSGVRGQAGNPIRTAYNSQEELTYSGPYPSRTGGARLTSGGLVSPPISTATTSGPVDVIARWYGDWGLDWYRIRTGIAGTAFYGWYDWRWNFTGSANYDQQRHPTIGWYRQDDPKVLDWQCYWLRKAGVKAVIPQAFDLNIPNWRLNTDRHFWIYQMMYNAPNCQALAYIHWAQLTLFDEPDVSALGTVEQIKAQWQSLYRSLTPDRINNDVLSYRGKRYFSVFTWSTPALVTAFGGPSQLAWFLKDRAPEIRRVGGYDGLAVLVHSVTSDAIMSRADLLAGRVLYLPTPYSGPVYSDEPSNTYESYVAQFARPGRMVTRGEAINVSTALEIVAPRHRLSIRRS